MEHLQGRLYLGLYLRMRHPAGDASRITYDCVEVQQ